MTDALLIAATGMRAEQAQIDTISNNVANLNSTGFRRQVVSFESVTAALDSASGDVLPATAASRGAGVIAYESLSQLAGELRRTGEVFDVAIDGNGFLEGLRSDGTPVYTRAGALHVGTDGLLVMQDSVPLSVNIQIPADAEHVTIDPDGRVTVQRAGNALPEEVGQLELASLANPSGLKAVGNNLFVATDDSGEVATGVPGQDGRGLIRQGYLESSNVQLTEELVALMLAQRGFELTSRVAQAADQMMSIVNGLYRQ